MFRVPHPTPTATPTLDDELAQLTDLSAEITAVEGELAQLIASTERAELLAQLTTPAALGQVLTSPSALEAFGDPTQRQAAMEGVLSGLRDTLSRLSTRAVSALSGAVSRVRGVTGAAGKRVAEFSRHIASRSWDATKAGTTTMRAYSYHATVMALDALQALPAVFHKLWTGHIPTTDASLADWSKRALDAITAIKLPGRRIEAVDDGKLKMVETAAKPEPATAEKLGYTQQTTTSLLNRAKSYFNGDPAHGLVSAHDGIGSLLLVVLAALATYHALKIVGRVVWWLITWTAWLVWNVLVFCVRIVLMAIDAARSLFISGAAYHLA
jgi:hypothetical protein